MRRTAVYRDDLFLEHQPGYGHPETPSRLAVIHGELDKPEIGGKFVYPEFAPATLEQIGRNHARSLITRVAATAGRAFDALDADTHTSARSYDAALLAAGSVIDGLTRLARGEIDNGFALVRPPGHHAERDSSMGFCLFNNVAIGARHALAELGMEKIFVYDWDLHHGNGTQHSFVDSDKVFYCSSHQYPFYPGTGALHEVGKGQGEGHTINLPLPGGQDDLAFARIVNELVAPLIRAYRPDCILVSCGFDIGQGDPLGVMRVSPAGFAYMTRVLVDLAEEVCGGRILVVLEGGYDLNAIRRGALAVLGVLADAPVGRNGQGYLNAGGLAALRAADVPLAPLEQARAVAKKYWKL